MADVADDAGDLIERTLEANIRAARSSIVDPMSNETGQCLYCGEDVPDGRRWCSTYCRDLEQLMSRK